MHATLRCWPQLQQSKVVENAEKLSKHKKKPRMLQRAEKTTGKKLQAMRKKQENIVKAQMWLKMVLTGNPLKCRRKNNSNQFRSGFSQRTNNHKVQRLNAEILGHQQNVRQFLVANRQLIPMVSGESKRKVFQLLADYAAQHRAAKNIVTLFRRVVLYTADMQGLA